MISIYLASILTEFLDGVSTSLRQTQEPGSANAHRLNLPKRCPKSIETMLKVQ